MLGTLHIQIVLIRNRTKTAFPVALQRRQKEPSPPPTRLSQLNYAMLRDTALRKKLQEIGVPSWGSKDLMKRRHIEWLNIYNANCDADGSVRKSKRQLLKELDEWETTQGGKANNNESKVMRKDFDGSGHMKSHKSDFDDLIAKARQKRAVPKQDETQGSSKSEDDTGQASAQPQDAIPSNGTGATLPEPQTRNNFLITPTASSPIDAQRPYENNESALSSIREKVRLANEGDSTRPLMSHESSMASARRRSSASSEGMHNPFGSPTRKVPMFALPEEPVREVESNATVQ